MLRVIGELKQKKTKVKNRLPEHMPAHTHLPDHVKFLTPQRYYLGINHNQSQRQDSRQVMHSSHKAPAPSAPLILRPQQAMRISYMALTQHNCFLGHTTYDDH